MKNIYLKAGKTEDVFNDLKDNFKGTLVTNNDEFNLALSSAFARGNIKGITFPEGMTYMQFDLVFHDDVILSMESLKTSPIFFAYCSQGSMQHSFGEQGERKIIKKEYSGILKSTSSVNSILYFEKHVPIKFYVIEIGTNTVAANEYNSELIKKLKNTFFHIKEDYLNISYQNSAIAQKIEELNTITHKGIVRNLLINRILENILELEIQQHTDGFATIAETVSSFTLKQINEIKTISNFVMNLSLELFTTDFIAQKTILFANRLQKEFKLTYGRSVQDLLVFMRIERGRI
jgi:hypothetical protein